MSSAYTQEDAARKTGHRSYANSIKQLFSGFYIRQSPGLGTPIDQIGFYYERKVYKNIFFGVGYAQWEALKLFTPAEEMAINENPISIPYKPVVGKLEYRSSYKMLDGYFFYKYSIGKRHYVEIGLGITYCWGLNAHLKYYIQASPTDAKAAYEARDAHYWGILPVVSYDYMLWKNRISIGADIKARYYSDRPKAQYDYGLHIGVNF